MSEIWTVGHQALPETAFLDLLAERGITLVVDVRAHPGSRASPQFGRDVMPGWLTSASVGYVHLDALGGRRRKQDVDPDLNAGWNNVSFKNYADHTLTPAYQQGIAELEELADARRAVIMCAEALPWRCHRLLISNTLVSRGQVVHHVMGGAGSHLHELGQWGATPVVDETGRMTYPAPDA